MRIGELSRRTGVSERLLRYYEAQGLLTPRRTSNGYRSYDEDACAVVGRIRCLLGAGLSTGTIAQVLPCVTTDGDLMVPTCPDSRASIAAESDRLARTISDLRTSKDLLDGILSS
jgi:DNA-binding transcriptional MerR regulator